MSEELKKKMYDHEVSPPAMVWDRLAAELDEAHPALSQKINAIEVIPPPAVWNDIAATLEENPELQFPAKLAAMEVTPPANAWNLISKDLAEDNEEKSSGRVIPFFRYAAAAAVVLAITLGGYRLFSSRNADPGIVANTPAKDINTVPSTNAVPAPVVTAPVTTPVLPASNNLPKEDFTATTTMHRVQPKNISQRQQTYAYMRQLESLSTIATASNFNFENVSLKGNIPASNFYVSNSNENRYLIFVNPDGKLVKISKKLADQLGCIYGSGNDQQCLDKVKQWKDKIAQAPISASTDNFMDIINMLKSLQENEL